MVYVSDTSMVYGLCIIILFAFMSSKRMVPVLDSRLWITRKITKNYTEMTQGNKYLALILKNPQLVYENKCSLLTRVPIGLGEGTAPGIVSRRDGHPSPAGPTGPRPVSGDLHTRRVVNAMAMQAEGFQCQEETGDDQNTSAYLG